MIHPCRYFLYAQGVPLLIIMITAITDEVGQDWLEENRHSSYSVPIITRSGINKSEGYRGEVFCNTTVFSDQPGENDTLSSISISPTKHLALEIATLTSNGRNSFPTKCVSGNYEVHTIDMKETEIDSIITKNGKLVVRK